MWENHQPTQALLPSGTGLDPSLFTPHLWPRPLTCRPPPLCTAVAAVGGLLHQGPKSQGYWSPRSESPGTELLAAGAFLWVPGTKLHPLQHYLCWSEVPVPRISVLFSLDELRELQKDCALYVGRMERVARHSSVSKEQEVRGAGWTWGKGDPPLDRRTGQPCDRCTLQELRMEIAKQELIVQAWEAASRVLRELSGEELVLGPASGAPPGVSCPEPSPSTCRSADV